MKNGLLNVKVWALALAAVAMTAGLSAQQAGTSTSQATPPGQATAQPGQASAQPGQALPIENYTVGQAKPPETPGVPVQQLTLDQAIQIALDHNLNLQVAKLDPLIQDYNLVSARAAFRPTITGSFNNNHQLQPVTSTLDGATSQVTTISQTYTTGISQSLPWYGGQFSVTFNNGRSSTNSKNTIRNPTFSSSLRANYSQPLLAGFKTDNQRSALKTQTIQRQITDVQLQATIENTKASVRTAYWNLRQAIERIQIQKMALDLAQRQLDDDKVKVEIGTMAPIETTTAEVLVAQDQQALLNAQIQWQTAELTLKQLLVSGPSDPLYQDTIDPVDQPTFAQTQVDIPAAIQTALANRTDIIEQRKSLEATDINLAVTKNSTLPNLSLSTSYSLAGSGGPQLARNGSPAVPGGYLDALSQIGTLAQPTWTVGFNFSYPIGMASAKASFARAQLQEQQAKQNLKVTELNIVTAVTNAGLAVRNTYLQLQAAQTAREVAQRNADAEQTRFDVGMSNPYNVATALNNLTTARLSELNAIIAYINAVAQFELVQRVGGS
jgi:outer membrane protein